MYGQRRRRNLNLLGDYERTRKPLLTDDTWGILESGLEEGYEEVEEEEYDQELDNDQSIAENEWETQQAEATMSHEKSKIFMIDGKPFAVKQQNKKPSFQESHTRITTYLENNLHAIVKILQQQHQIESITAFINDAVKYYLLERYQD